MWKYFFGFAAGFNLFVFMINPTLVGGIASAVCVIFFLYTSYRDE